MEPSIIKLKNALSPKTPKSKIIYNSQITIENIPTEAYNYVVNGKSAIEWIMERYAITTHKDSGITNNPNDWATEHNNPHYILDLLLSVISLSMETVEIVHDYEINLLNV
jgi:predicted helicase